MKQTAVKKSNGKTYIILREYIGVKWGSSFVNPNEGQLMVEFQAINPKTGEAWQRRRDARKSEFDFGGAAQ